MSVKSLLENDFEFKEFMKKHQPKKTDFTSVTGLKIFNTSCSIQAKPSGFCNAGLIGTACDYMFRFMVASYIDNKRISFLLWKTYCRIAASRLYAINIANLVKK